MWPPAQTRSWGILFGEIRIINVLRVTIHTTTILKLFGYLLIIYIERERTEGGNMGTKEQWDPPRFGAYFQEKEPCFPICAPSAPPVTFPSISSTRELVRDADSRARPQTS